MFVALQSHGVRISGTVDRGGLCRVVEGGQTKGREEVVFLPNWVGGVKAVAEVVTVPMDKHVLKVVECGRDEGEVVLPKVVL